MYGKWDILKLNKVLSIEVLVFYLYLTILIRITYM